MGNIRLFHLSLLLVLSATILTCIHSVQAAGGMGDPTNLSASERKDIEEFIEDMMECSWVPGLTLSVVGHDGDDWWTYAHSFGNASEAGDFVNTKTLFNIGSTTKAFTATLLAMLLEESDGKYTWDTPVRDILGDTFLLQDEYRTNHVTLVDLLSHRVGMARHDFLWILDFITTKEELFERLHLIGMDAEFRTEFIYNNLMYALAGKVAEEIGGKSWEELIQEKIFDRLGMTSSNFLDRMGPDFEGLARVKYLINGSLVQTDMSLYESVTPVTPAGSIVSNADDMAKWMAFQLSGGKDDNNLSLISPDALYFTHKPQMSIQPSLQTGIASLPNYPVSESYSTYSLGWFQGHYRGYKTTRHGGSLLGYETLITMFKQPRFAIYTSMNGPMTTICIFVESLIHMYISDKMLGKTPWLDKESACSFPEEWEPEISESRDFPGAAFYLNKTIEPSRALGDFVGTYGSYLYGDLEVSLNAQEQRLEATAKNGIFKFAMYPSGEDNTFQTVILGTKSFFDRSDIRATSPQKPTEVKFKTKEGSDEIYQLEMWPTSDTVVYEKGLDSSNPPKPDYVDKKEDECKEKSSASTTVASLSLIYLLLGYSSL